MAMIFEIIVATAAPVVSIPRKKYKYRIQTYVQDSSYGHPKLASREQPSDLTR